jgi:hypothetical protein
LKLLNIEVFDIQASAFWRASPVRRPTGNRTGPHGSVCRDAAGGAVGQLVISSLGSAEPGSQHGVRTGKNPVTGCRGSARNAFRAAGNMEHLHNGSKFKIAQQMASWDEIG